ncbi:carboxypeptidase O-like isoform X1 [Apostichopus japonicus]|uniref:carboxypeptidase O-like isoform X1 n=1 Tax=Stichopus japonicus TaxID=307972 RepID=UPI003AB365E5
MKFVVLLAAVAALSSAASFPGKTEHYRGNQLIRITVEYEEDLKWLRNIEEKMNLDFWTDPSTIRPVDVMVPRDFTSEFKRMLNKRELYYKVLRQDLQDDVDNDLAEAMRALQKKARIGIQTLDDFDYSIYHPFDEIQQWATDVANEYSFVTKFKFGETYEGREIGALEIAAPANAMASDPKPVVYFEGGIHAREWISPATVMFFTGKLLEMYNNGDADARRVLGMFDLHIVPSLNGDGYVFTWTDERLWRKSRQPNPDFGCVGTDLNRNFDAFWGQNGASPWPCSIVYRGFTPLNNPETTAVDAHFQALKAAGRVTKVFIDWHSYSQLILAPWSYSSAAELPAESENQLAAAAAMAAAMNSTNSVAGGYIHGPSARLLYEASGASNDYGFASTPAATYTYVVELRDTGEYGFVLPADQILPSGEESYDGVIALLDYVINNDYD